MGLFSGLFGNAGVADLQEVQQELGGLLADGEQLDVAFSLIRDQIVFTNRRLILVDKQGLTGSKVDYQSIPYRSIVRKRNNNHTFQHGCRSNQYGSSVANACVVLAVGSFSNNSLRYL